VTKKLVRICFEKEGLHYSVFSEDDGKLMEFATVENAKEVLIEGTVVIVKPEIDLGMLCLHAHIDGLNVERKGSLVIIRGKTS